MRYDHPAYGDWEKRVVAPESGPTHLTILSTGRCNLACFMCGHSLVDGLPVTIDANAIDQWLEKAQRVFLAGGEPLWMSENANPEAARIFDALIKRHTHLKINAYTNGTLMNEAMAKLVLDRFESIHFSVDTVDPAIYEKIRGKPLLPTVLENIERLARMKRERGLGRDDAPRINFNTILMNATVRGLPAVAQKLASLGGHKQCIVKLNNVLGFDYQQVLEKGVPGNGKPRTPGDITEVEKIVRSFQGGMAQEVFDAHKFGVPELANIRAALEKIHAEHGIEVEDQAYFLKAAAQKVAPTDAEAVCPAPWVTGDIHENGNVLCCCANSTILGNVREQTFDEIWNGPAAQDLRASFIRGEMKGCIQSGCPSLYDYFTVRPDAYAGDMLATLERTFEQPERISSILLFRSAPDYQSHLAARTLAKYFPHAAITVVTNEAGAEGVRRWDLPVEVAIYPDDHFEPETFARWWGSGKHHSLAVALYNNNERRGYERVELILASLDAGYRVGVRPDGRFLKF